MTSDCVIKTLRCALTRVTDEIARTSSRRWHVTARNSTMAGGMNEPDEKLSGGIFRTCELSSSRSVQRTQFTARGARRRDAVGRTTGGASTACCLGHATDAHWRPPLPSTVCYDCQSPSAPIVRDRAHTDCQKRWITVTDVKGCDI